MITGHRPTRTQRGQVVPIAALVFTVLVGATALAVDLSLQTHSRRTYQNVSDTAALTGARDLPTTVAATDQASAVQSAFKSIQTNLQLPANWWGSPANTCPSVGVCEKVTNYTNNGTTLNVTVNTPAQSTSNSLLKCSGSPAATDPCLHYVEVIIHGSSSSTNPLGGFLGFGAATEGATSIAFHNGTQVPFGFALFSNTIATTGNQLTIVKGDVYAQRRIDPQSGGQAAFCADDWTMSGGGTSHGFIVLGAPQFNQSSYSSSPDGQNSVLPATAKVITQGAVCTGLGAGLVGESATVLSTSGCPAITGLPAGTTMSYVVGTLACVITPAMPVPTFGPPTHTGTKTNIVQVTCATWSTKAGGFWPPTSGFMSGLYDITHSSCGGNKPDLLIDMVNPGTLSGYTFYLEPGAVVNITGGSKLIITPYNPNTGSPPATDNLNDDGVYAFFGDPSGAAQQLNVGASGGSSNNTIVEIGSTGPPVVPGSITMTAGTVSIGSNAQLKIDSGQAVVNSWQDQSGNHPNPSITFGGSSIPGEQEVLELVQ